MILSIDRKEDVAAWLLEKINAKASRFFDDFKTLAVFDRDRILGAVVFDSFTFVDCDLHIAIEDKRCVTRETIRQIMAYPFEQLNLTRVSAEVSERNASSLELVQRLGFQLEGRKRQGEGDCDRLIFGMLKSQCRWLDGKR
jgi:RimJ/RimL family protein N-acetyltransferase